MAWFSSYVSRHMHGAVYTFVQPLHNSWHKWLTYMCAGCPTYYHICVCTQVVLVAIAQMLAECSTLADASNRFNKPIIMRC